MYMYEVLDTGIQKVQMSHSPLRIRERFIMYARFVLCVFYLLMF